MVLQNGQAAPTMSAPVATSSLARAWLTRLPVSSPRNTRPPPAPQQKDRSRARGGSMTSAVRAMTSTRLVVDAAIAAEIAGIVKDDPFCRLRCGADRSAVPGQELAVMLDLDGAAPYSFQSVCHGADAMRTDGDDLLHLGLFAARPRFGSASCSKTQIVAQPPRRIAGAVLFLQHAERGSEMLHARDAERGDDFAALRIVGAHAAEPQAVLLRAVEDRELLLLDELVALACEKPSALPLRSRLRNSFVPYSSSQLPVFTAPRRSPMMIGRCWMPTGH